jgi:hypothetical protein
MSARGIQFATTNNLRAIGYVRRVIPAEHVDIEGRTSCLPPPAERLILGTWGPTSAIRTGVGMVWADMSRTAICS